MVGAGDGGDGDAAGSNSHVRRSSDAFDHARVFADAPTPAQLGSTHGLSEWLGRLLVAEAVQRRARGYWLRRQSEEEGTFGGVLADLAERAAPVVVHLANGRRHRGQVSALGTDFVVIATGAREVLVALVAITSVHTLPSERATVGDRPVVGALTVAEALAALAEERPRVLFVGADVASPISGELRAVGRDLAQVRLDGGGTAYVALASVLEMSAAESG